MHESQTLLALQACDTDIRRAEKQLDELPEKRAILDVRHKTTDVNTLRAKAEELTHRLDREIAATGDEIATIDDKIAEVQATLDSGNVTNPKEVHNLAREMDALKRRKDKLENETLQTMERLEKARGQAEKIDAALEQLAAKERSLVGEFREKGGEIQATLEQHRVRRDELARALDSALLDRYESIRAAKHGIGAAKLEAGTCSACRMELPSERVSDLLAGADVGICPACRRLLVVRGFEDE